MTRDLRKSIKACEVEILKKIKNFLNSHKDKPLFKGKLFAIIVFIIALLVSITMPDNHKTNNSSDSSSVQQENGGNEVDSYEFHIGTSNIVALGIGIAALAAVKIKREKDLNGRHDKIEKNNKEDE